MEHNNLMFKLYEVFTDRTRRIGFVMRKHENEDDIAKELSDRLSKLITRSEQCDALSKKTTLYDEVEILLIRVVLKFYRQNGCLPKSNQFTHELFLSE